MFYPDNPSLLSHVPVTVQVLDVNDNPPEIKTDEEVVVCESSRPGQVSIMHVHMSGGGGDKVQLIHF
jgi:hypothetical protein